jgi:tetratricopeptide (TPR) repeat protein
MRTRDVCFASLLVLAVTGLRGESVSPAPNPDVARNLNNLGSFYFDRGEFARAETVLSQAAAMGEPNASLNLAATLRAEARYADAEKFYLRALAIRESEPAPSPKRIASALYGLALLYRDTARYAEAEQFARRALEHEGDVASTLNVLGMVVQAEGRTAEAEALFRHALEAAEGSSTPDAPILAEILINLGNADRLKGNLASAQAQLERAVSLLNGTGPNSTRMAAALEGLSVVVRARGDVQQARAIATRALLLFQASVGTDHPDYAAALSNLALIDLDLHDVRKARQLFLEALGIDEQKLGPTHPRIATDLNNLGVASAGLHDYASAESYFRRALAMESKTAQAAFWMANLASLYAHEGRRADALELYRHATAILRDANAPGDLRVAKILDEYATLLRAAGSFAEAEDAQTRAMRIRVRYANTNPGEVKQS